MGVSRLIMGVVARLAIMEAADPGLSSPAVRMELMNHRSVLLQHYERMVNGVKCAAKDDSDTHAYRPPFVLTALCADIYTDNWRGQTRYHANRDDSYDTCRQCLSNGMGGCQATHFPDVGYDQACITRVDTEFSQLWSDAHAVEEEFRQSILDDMPLFEMRDLINVLYLYANPTPDLTQARQQISNWWESLCLDVQWGGTAAGTPVWMWPCSGAGNGAQRWVYSRSERKIRNPAAGRCMDVRKESDGLFRPFIADCSSSDSQRWSYDLTTGEVYSGVGSTLTLFAGRSQSSTPILRQVTPGYGMFLEPFWHLDTGNPCVQGAALNATDGACVRQICDADPFCCSSSWDSICVGEVASVCQQSCPPL